MEYTHNPHLTPLPRRHWLVVAIRIVLILLAVAVAFRGMDAVADTIVQDRWKVTNDPKAPLVAGQKRVAPTQQFVVSRTLTAADTVLVFRNGLLQSQGEDYQLLGAMVVSFTACKITEGDLITLVYLQR